MKRNVKHLIWSVILAVGLWLYVVNVISPESEQVYYNIPVVLNNESVLNEKGLMRASNDTPTVTLKLRGNRSDLNSLKNSDITLIADLSKINDPGEQTLTYTISFPGNFASNAFEVLSHTPDSITLEIVEWSTKEIPVYVEYTGSAPSNYIVFEDETVMDYEKVTITGPKGVVDRIHKAVININLSNQKETMSQAYRYTLCELDGDPVDAAQVLTNVAQINVTTKIQRVKELQLKVEIDKQDSGLTDEDISILYSQQTIKVAGSERMLASLGDTLLLGTKTLTEILENGTFTFDIPELPKEIRNMSGVTQVNVEITLPGMEYKEMTVSDIQTQNVPDGLISELGTKMQTLVLIGPAEQIAMLQSEDVRIVVDLSNVDMDGQTETEMRCKAQVVILNPECADVSAVVVYKILVKLTVSKP